MGSKLKEKLKQLSKEWVSDSLCYIDEDIIDFFNDIRIQEIKQLWKEVAQHIYDEKQYCAIQEIFDDKIKEIEGK